MPPGSVSDLSYLAGCLRQPGVRRVFGDTAVAGLPFHHVGDAELARLVADADGRVQGGNGAALTHGGTRLRVSSAPAWSPRR